MKFSSQNLWFLLFFSEKNRKCAKKVHKMTKKLQKKKIKKKCSIIAKKFRKFQKKHCMKKVDLPTNTKMSVNPYRFIQRMRYRIQTPFFQQLNNI